LTNWCDQTEVIILEWHIAAGGHIALHHQSLAANAMQLIIFCLVDRGLEH
jgi:hypothetical protein